MHVCEGKPDPGFHAAPEAGLFGTATTAATRLHLWIVGSAPTRRISAAALT